MKKAFILAIASLVVVTTAFAADFSPTPMVLSAPPAINYAFDGTALSIPVSVSGTNGSMNLLVFSKGRETQLDPIVNGFLGWHFVNKIDTCLYVSPDVDAAVGSNTIVWDGKDADGGVVPEGDYTYYIYAFDNKNVKICCTRQIGFGWNENSVIQSVDDDGNPLNNPIIWTGGPSVSGGEERVERKHFKWTIGSDPDDYALRDSTYVMAYADKMSIALDPADHTKFFKATQTPAAAMEIGKYEWVPSGESALQTDWADGGISTFSLPSFCAELHNSLAIVNDVIFVFNQNFFDSTSPTELVYIDMEDGTEITRVDVSLWWTNPDEGELGGQCVGGPHDLCVGPNGTLSISAHTTCVNHMIDPFSIDGEPGGDIEDLTLWVNLNGDYTGDHNFEETAALPWVCNDFNVGPYKYNSAVDANGFTIFPSYDMGAVSYGLYAPDGTGMGYKAFAGETAGYKWGDYYVDYGSMYDGLYSDNSSQLEDTAGWWYTGHDSVTGIITSGVGVADDAPAAFSVAQNAPNPFNPTTTISFNLAEAGTVSIDVFNIAGQKIDTIANEFMDAGSHSVVWDATDFSAGVYFYTVTSSDFSKTMKMTLVK